MSRAGLQSTVMADQVTIHGSNVIDTVGGITTTSPKFSNTEAVEAGVQLQQQRKAIAQARLDKIEQQLKAGDPIVMPHPASLPDTDQGRRIAEMVFERAPELRPDPTVAEPEPEPVEQAKADPVVERNRVDVQVVSTSWNADTNRFVVNLETDQPVNLYRVVGNETSTFALEPGKTSRRAWKANPGDWVTVRENDRTGRVIYTEQVPGPGSDEEE